MSIPKNLPIVEIGDPDFPRDVLGPDVLLDFIAELIADRKAARLEADALRKELGRARRGKIRRRDEAESAQPVVDIQTPSRHENGKDTPPHFSRGFEIAPDLPPIESVESTGAEWGAPPADTPPALDPDWIKSSSPEMKQAYAEIMKERDRAWDLDASFSSWDAPPLDPPSPAMVRARVKRNKRREALAAQEEGNDSAELEKLKGLRTPTSSGRIADRTAAIARELGVEESHSVVVAAAESSIDLDDLDWDAFRLLVKETTPTTKEDSE
jgi:hypothetical protein